MTISRRGERIGETISLNAGGEARTEASVLLVDAIDTSGGRVVVTRRHPLGAATRNGMAWDHDDLPAALAELFSGLPVLARLRNITSGAKSHGDVVPDGAATAWPLSRLPALLFPDIDPPIAFDRNAHLAEVCRKAREYYDSRQIPVDRQSNR